MDYLEIRLNARVSIMKRPEKYHKGSLATNLVSDNRGKEPEQSLI